MAGSSYQTEINNFEKVTANGAAGNGPATFTVQTPDGHTLQYGNGGNSQVLAYGSSTAMSWLLNEVSDPAGNTMTISYSTATGTAVPSMISWTPTAHGSSTYLYTMVFSYGTNVLPPSGYVAGTPFQNPNLLASITINYSGSQVKQYVLTYQQSSTTGRDRLTQMQECSSSTSSCLFPTTITYQNGGTGVATSATTAVSSPVASCTRGDGSIARYDFNGDGYTDLLYAVSGTCYVAFGSASGYGAPVSTGISGVGGMLAGDLLGRGEAGILANNGGVWYFYSWNGSSFVGASTGLAYDSSAQQFALADINGDGLPDLVTLYGTSTPTVTTRLNTSSGSTPSFSGPAVTAFAQNGVSASIFGADYQPGGPPFFDFNGDGRQDLAMAVTVCGAFYMGACVQYVNQIWELIAQTNGTFAGTQVTSLPTQIPLVGNLAFANVNNDACTDAVVYTGALLSACNGSTATTLNADYPVVAVMDWNGDGLADLIENNSGTLYVQLSTGSGFAAAAATSIPYAANCTYITFDADADGLDDLACASSQAGATGFAYYLHNGAGQMPDLMASMTDGYGNSVSPSYISLGRSLNTYYFGGAHLPAYPYAEYLGPLYIVTSSAYSDPTNPGSQYSISHYYAYSYMSLQGRGYAGFGGLESFDTRNAISEMVYRGTDFPYTGIVTSDSANENNNGNQPIFSATYSPTLTASGSAYQQIYSLSGHGVTRNDYEVEGARAWQLITTTTASVSFDAYGNRTNVSRTVTDQDSNSPYYGNSWTTATTNTPSPNTSTWCLNLFTTTQVAYSSTLSGSTSVTRTKNFTPDTINCDYTQIVTEPASSSYKVTEALAYDTFGNVNSDTVTGVGMGARQTLINWGATGQLPASMTDPSGATTSFGYDWRFGLPSSATDANNLLTSWQYNDFGRKTQENRPDGTYTQWAYNNCASYGGCLLGSNTLALAHFVYAVGGGIVTDGTTYYDMLERPLVANSMLLSGYDRREVRYDTLGRVAQQSSPCMWVNMPTLCTYWTTSSYDLRNRLIQVQRPISSTNSSLQTTTYSYQGRATTITDPQSHSRTIITDVNGWLRQTADAYGYTVTLGYDSSGSKISAKDSQGSTLWSGSYAYGLAAYLTSETDMDRGAWSYTVDALGERTGWTDAKGQHFSASYDALSRPLTRSEPDLFTQWTWGFSAASHNIGKLASVCTGAGGTPTNCTSVPGYSEAETYDSIGRLSQRAITLPGEGTFTYTSQYDPATGLLNSLIYPTSTNGCQLVVNYGYGNGILGLITDGSNATQCGSTGTVFWQANAENPDRQITQETLGNGIVTNRTFDAVTHWLGAVQSGVGGGTGVKNLSFLYDEMGNVTQRQDNNLGLTENVYYDNDYRLSYTTLGGVQNLSISYDATGNITSRSDVAGGAAWTYDPNRKHAVTQAGSGSYAYSYDANGNMATRQGSTIVWSSYNYPTAISAGSGSTAESVTLNYGPDRQRWYQYYSGNGTTESTYYAGAPLEIVTSGSVTNYRHYIYAGSEPVAVYSRSSSGTNAVNYVLSDHQGSVAALTNSTGGTVVSESFTPYGNRRNPATWSGAASNTDLTTAAGITRQGYTFQTQLGLWMGMNHMNGRVQDSITGRFLSADPNIPDPRNTQDYNRYSYVDNNPLTLVDPSGFCASGSVSLTEVVVCGSRDPLNGDGGSISGGSPPLPPDAQKQLLEQDLEKYRETCPSIYVCQNEPPPPTPPDPQQPDSCPKDNPDCLPQKKPSQCYEPSAASPMPGGGQGGSESDMAGVENGVTLADAAFIAGSESTAGLRAPGGINLQGLRFMGGVTAYGGAALSIRSGVVAYQTGNTANLGLSATDLGVNVAGLLFPPTAPFVAGYDIGRVGGDAAVAVSNLLRPNILDQAALYNNASHLTRAILGCDD